MLQFLIKLLLIPPLVYTISASFRRFGRWRSPGLARTLEIILVLGGSAYFTVRMTQPLSADMWNHSVQALDSVQLAYVEAWDAHALRSSAAHIFDMNIFYPARNTLSLSENLLGNLPFVYPAYALTGNAMFAHNVVLLTAFFLSALAMYLFVRLATRSYLAAAVAAFVFAFAPARIYQMQHVQLLTMQWTPLILIFFYRLLRSRRMGDVVGFGICLYLQILCSLHAGAMALVIITSYVIALLAVERGLVTRHILLQFVAALGAVGLALAPVALHYMSLLHQGGLSTLLTPVKDSATLSSYLDGGRTFLYRGFLLRFRAGQANWEKQLFFGFVPWALALLAVGVYFLSWASKMHHNTLPITNGKQNDAPPWLVLGSILSVIIGVLLSLGPYVIVHGQPTSIRLPYFWLSRWLPGFSVFRDTSRFGFVALFGVAVLAGIGVQKLAGWLFRTLDRGSISAALGAEVLFILMWEFTVITPAMVPITSPDTVPPEYRWLARQPPGSVTLELPETTVPWDQRPFDVLVREAHYIYNSTYHWQPLINGYSGHIPPVSNRTSALAVQLPCPNAVAQLKAMHLQFVVLHTQMLSEVERSAWERLDQRTGLCEVAHFQNAVIYKVMEPGHCSSSTRGSG